MSKIKFPVFLSAMLLAASPVPAMEQQAIDPQQQVAMIDSVAAVVNDDVIPRHELDERLRTVISQLRKQGEHVDGQCRTCEADDLCGTEVARVIRKE